MKLRTAILVALLLLCAAPAFSQGCAMCFSSAKGSTAEGQRAMRRGVLILLVPPLGFMTLGVWMACRYAKKRDLEQSLPASLALPEPPRRTKPLAFAFPQTTASERYRSR